MIILLDSELEVPGHFYQGNVNDLVQQLPITLKVQHIRRRVLKLEAMDPTEATKSLDIVEDAKSLNFI